MCEDCGGICAVVDAMIAEYFEHMGSHSPSFSAGYRSRFHSTNVKGITGQSDSTSLADLVEQAACINMTPQELEEELIKRSGFEEAVPAWIQDRIVPNGLVRKIILTNAEMIIREYGATPELTILQAA